MENEDRGLEGRLPKLGFLMRVIRKTQLEAIGKAVMSVFWGNLILEIGDGKSLRLSICRYSRS